MGSCKSETPPVRMTTNQEKRDPAKRVSLPSFLPGEQKHGLHDKRLNENGEKRRWNLPAKRQYIDDEPTGTKHSTFVVALRQSISVSLGCTQPLSRRRERVNERQREREGETMRVNMCTYSMVGLFFDVEKTPTNKQQTSNLNKWNCLLAHRFEEGQKRWFLNER